MVKINQILTTGLLGAILAIGITGCGGMNNPLPPKQMNSTKIDLINIEYKFSDDTSLSKNDIMRALTSHMSANSNYRTIQIKGNPTGDTFGKKVKYNSNNIIISYVNGNQNCRTKECSKEGGSLTKVIFELPITIKENSKNNYIIKLEFPINYTIKPHTNAIGLEHDTLDKVSKLEADAKRMFNSLKDKPLEITKYLSFKGEVNTKYPDKAVYANFKRILGEFRNWRSWSNSSNERISESKKQNSFTLKINKNSYPLYVEVYPYRNGSKVVYSTRLKYTIDSIGNSTLTSKDISELHKNIEAIINN